MRSILFTIFLCVFWAFPVYGNVKLNFIVTHLMTLNRSQTCRSGLPAVSSLEIRPVLPVSIKEFPQFANVHFITDANHFSLEFDYVGLCGNLGYGVPAASCGEGLAGNSCPYTADFVDACLTTEEWCKKNGYTKIDNDCTIPMYPANACPKNEVFFQSCREDIARACTDEGYSLNCDIGYIHTSDVASCPYDTDYKICTCNPCEGYDYTAEEANAQGYEPVGSVCNSCGTMKYMRQNANCGDYVECECGGIGTACWSGTKKLFASCQSCYVPCPEGQLDRNYYWGDGALKCFLPSVN